MFIGFRWPILWNSDDICEFSLPNDALLGLNGSEADTVSMAEATEKTLGHAAIEMIRTDEALCQF